MNWKLRILLALFLLLALMPAAAWLFFPWYAQPLIDRLLEGKPFHVEVSGLGLPGLTGVGFRSIKVRFITPPDDCSEGSLFTTGNYSLSSLPTAHCPLPTIFPQHCYVKTQAKRETFLKENISSPSSPL